MAQRVLHFSAFIYTYLIKPLLICIPYSNNIPTEILTQPEGLTVFLHVNETAVFVCITTGGDISGWIVNGTGYGDLPSAMRDDLIPTHDLVGANDVHNLTIPAKTQYNVTTIQFSTRVFGSDPVLSEIASLALQGSQTNIVYTYMYMHVSLEFRV